MNTEQTLKALSDQTCVLANTLRKAASKGRLKARQSGFTWLSTRRDVDEWLETAVLKPRGEKEMLYTEEQVKLAHFAHTINAYPASVQDALWKMAGEDEGECQSLHEKYDRGQAILADAHLVVGRARFLCGVDPHKDLGGIRSPQVRVPAGYTATQEHYRLVGLRKEK